MNKREAELDSSRRQRDDEDRLLVERILAGDEHAFTNLFNRYGLDVRRTCYAILGNFEDAEDAVQEVFTKVSNKLNTYRVEQSFRPWLLGVARNQCIDMQRAGRKNVYVDLTTVEFSQPSREQGPEDRAVDRESFRQRLAQIKELPDKYRLVIGLYLQDLSYAEIAERTGQKISTVKIQIHRARKMLEAGRDQQEGGA